MSDPQSNGPVVIIGAGGHAKVIIEILREQGFTVFGLTDAGKAQQDVLGARILGGDEVLPSLLEAGIGQVFVALGDNDRRLAMGKQVQAMGFELVNAISPRAVISPSVSLGRGVAVMAGAVINADAQICDLAIINTGACIDHDCVIGMAAHVGPGACLAGAVHIGACALMGVGSSARPGSIVGEGAIVGAGSSVVTDIAPHATAVGVPARPMNGKS